MAETPRQSDITPKGVYLNRRKLMTTGVAGLAGGLLGGLAGGRRARAATHATKADIAAPGALRALPDAQFRATPLQEDDSLTPYGPVTQYNNFYEFGTDKDDPATHADAFNARPWTVTVDGLVSRPLTIDVDDLIARTALEERIYRMRCVEAWSMVIPWIGFPLSALLDKVEPLGSAKYVRFESVERPEEMRGQRSWPRILPWPYEEGLRLDEARHPLTLMAVGLYGEILPNQNGAPLRLVVPWKYGYKSAKSIVRITLTDQEPVPTWVRVAPHRYGFYSNVNPDVGVAGWSQARERRIGEFFKRPTLTHNGYAEQVAHLYAGMDLTKYY